MAENWKLAVKSPKNIGPPSLSYQNLQAQFASYASYQVIFGLVRKSGLGLQVLAYYLEHASILVSSIACCKQHCIVRLRMMEANRAHYLDVCNRKEMYLLDENESRGSLHCSTGPPVTPDSVLGTLLVDGSSSSRGDLKAPISSSSLHDISPSQHLLNIIKTESAEQYELKPNYLHSSVIIQAPKESKDQGVSERCRRRTCEWMYDITDYFALKREVVGIALFYVDRFFTITFEGTSSSHQKVPVTRREFQLVALTGLYLAVKLHGESRQENLGSPSQPSDIIQPFNRLKFSLAICASISRNQFTPSEIEKCERAMLKTLDWHVNPIVSSGTVIDSLLMYLPSVIGAATEDESLALFVYDSSKYLAELSISVPALCLVYKASVISYASILYALDTLSNTKFGSSSSLTAQSRQEYEKLIIQVSSHHFDREKDNVQGAKRILKAICPNLCELFKPPSSTTPMSPSSVDIS